MLPSRKQFGLPALAQGPRRAPLAAFIAFALGVPLTLSAQDTPPPGLYTSVDESEIYIIQPNGDQVDVRTGESVVVNQDGVTFIADRPQFLNWPCGTSFAGNRGTLPTFSLDSLPPEDRIGQVVDLYFSNQQVLEGSPRFENGEFHGAFPAGEIDQYVSNARWYTTGDALPGMSAKRPSTLLIGLFYGTGQVVVDTNHLEALKAEYGDDPIPTLFQYEEENVVPISWYGDNPTPEQILANFQSNGVKPADVPLWYAGDQHVALDPGALADLAGVPPLSEISPERQAQLREDIEQNGFAAKPVNLALVPGKDTFIADEGDRLRVAASMGVTNVPVMFSVYDAGVIASQCGLEAPVEAAGVLGVEAGETPEAPEAPPETPEQPDEPANPAPPPPPEIEPPQPPQPELPVSPD
ncbi:MAG: hypothetical protein V2I57_01770 [Xanthomonadales bacterium]|jgi:hypothetical protein|nr:hypothetical protein [Xanthomonadales bacterium]